MKMKKDNVGGGGINQKLQQLRELYESGSMTATDEDVAPPADINPGKVIQQSNLQGISKKDSLQHSLFSNTNNHFECTAFSGSYQLPTILTRVPIFMPIQRKGQREFLDDDLALHFDTPWGHGRRHGPPLSIYDEDTLLALDKLRSCRLFGDRSQFPIKTTRNTGQRNSCVHAVVCNLDDIQKVCRTARGGKSNRLRYESVKRLAATVIELNAKTSNVNGEMTSQFKLIDFDGERFDNDAILYVQFSPLVSHWLEKSSTLIDWDVRCQLNNTGKAIHRFLSSQRKHYEIGVPKLMTAIGYTKNIKYFSVELKRSLKKLTDELGWLTYYDIDKSNKDKYPQGKLVTHRK